MFERYTEKARRTIFFARYEASQFGSSFIESEHLLLGLLREDKALSFALLRSHSMEDIRKQIEEHTTTGQHVPPSVDLQLSDEGKRILILGADEAQALGHRHIGTEHLLLGMLREDGSFAAAILRERGISLEQARAYASNRGRESLWRDPVRLAPIPPAERIELHGQPRNPEYIRKRVEACRTHPFHWEKKPWAPRDIVIRRGKGNLSFDLTLAQNPDFELVSSGWTRDHCAVCSWELCASLGADHSTGYTNGRDWLCTECYEKFWSRPDFFAAGFSDLT